MFSDWRYHLGVLPLLGAWRGDLPPYRPFTFELPALSLPNLNILGTASMLAYVQGDAIDLIGPIPQVPRLGMKPFGFGAQLTSIVLLPLLGTRLAQSSITVAANVRLPLVAGWNHLLPAWFTRLHKVHRAPVSSLLVGSAATLVLRTSATTARRRAAVA